MQEIDRERVELRRETHDLNERLADLVTRLGPVDHAAASAIKNARSALFEAWTILCSPPEDDEDH